LISSHSSEPIGSCVSGHDKQLHLTAVALDSSL
jgi:hypothetical protein